MECFDHASRLICRIGEGLRLRCKDVRIYSHTFLFNLPMLFWVRRYYKSLCVYADIISILHNLSESANHGRFTGTRIYRGQANLGGRKGGVTGRNKSNKQVNEFNVNQKRRRK